MVRKLKVKLKHICYAEKDCLYVGFCMAASVTRRSRDLMLGLSIKFSNEKIIILYPTRTITVTWGKTSSRNRQKCLLSRPSPFVEIQQSAKDFEIPKKLLKSSLHSLSVFFSLARNTEHNKKGCKPSRIPPVATKILPSVTATHICHLLQPVFCKEEISFKMR